MRIRAVRGGSQRDRNAVHFSYYTKAGLGYEKTIAIYYPKRNVLEIHPKQSRHLSSIMTALRKYWKEYKQRERPVNVKYW